MNKANELTEQLNSELAEFRRHVQQYQIWHYGHDYAGRVECYKAIINRLGVGWMDERQPEVKKLLDQIEQEVKGDKK